MFEDFALAFLGLIIVFTVIALLMLGVILLGAVAAALNKPRAVLPDPVAPLAERARLDARPVPGMVPAPGSAGEVDLHTVDDRTAALLMAIVADDLGCEPNELTFVSIKEI
ncbi:MAG: hypothetical protein FWG93_01195 [Oscillospiraceae bacterium]|nr:hypothetical protein [Oscillospiraceae bacterium]